MGQRIQTVIKELLGYNSWILVRVHKGQLYKGRVEMVLEDAIESATADTTVIAAIKTRGPVHRIVLFRGDRLK